MQKDFKIGLAIGVYPAWLVHRPLACHPAKPHGKARATSRPPLNTKSLSPNPRHASFAMQTSRSTASSRSNINRSQIANCIVANLPIRLIPNYEHTNESERQSTTNNEIQERTQNNPREFTLSRRATLFLLSPPNTMAPPVNGVKSSPPTVIIFPTPTVSPPAPNSLSPNSRKRSGKGVRSRLA